MKKTLTKSASKLWHHVDGVRVEGAHNLLYGDVSGLRGDVSGLSGDASGLSGDVDACEITQGERDGGICVADLIQEDQK